jgi:hypothetical protein
VEQWIRGKGQGLTGIRIDESGGEGNDRRRVVVDNLQEGDSHERCSMA